MRRRAALLLALAAACGGESELRGPAAPPVPQAAVVMEPPTLRVGDVARIEVAVATPPGFAVRPLAPPAAELLGPLWLLDVEALPVQKQEQRWTHRTRLRVRAREVGSGTWPALALELVGPEGQRSRLETAPRPFEVVSVLPAFPERVTPFPLRRPEAPASGTPPLLAAAGGAAAALAAVAAVALLRRGRRRAAARAARAAEAAARAGAAPWLEALAELAEAAAAADTDWRGAADRCARTLRRYGTRRWQFPIEARTTEELAGLAPPFAATLRWPAAYGWLRELDELRFRPAGGPEAAAHVRRIAEQARRWVAETIPPEVAR